jgi:hypothetical protein
MPPPPSLTGNPVGVGAGIIPWVNVGAGMGMVMPTGKNQLKEYEARVLAFKERPQRAPHLHKLKFLTCAVCKQFQSRTDFSILRQRESLPETGVMICSSCTSKGHSQRTFPRIYVKPETSVRKTKKK